MKSVSVQEKIRLIGQLTTSDLNAWEWDFVAQVKNTARTAATAGQVTRFSEKQIDKIEQIYEKHFG